MVIFWVADFRWRNCYQHSNSILLICGLHVQNVIWFLTIVLFRSSKKMKAKNWPWFFSARFQANILPYRQHFKCVSMILNLNSYVVNEKYLAGLALIGISKATYQCLSSAVRGIPKWIDCSVKNWLINWLTFILNDSNELEIATRWF